MNKLKLQIITPIKVALTEEIDSITAPSKAGEITILPKHVALFSVLKEGVVMIKKNGEESFLSIGGGYLETDGKEVRLLVSRAYHQDEIDEAEVKKAQEEAEKRAKEAPTEDERQQAMEMVRRSIVDMKVLKRVKRKTH